jgi:hypothetical protein
MGDSTPLWHRHLVGADVEAAIDGRRVTADDFAAVPERQLEAERAFASGSRAEDGENRSGRSQI